MGFQCLVVLVSLVPDDNARLQATHVCPIKLIREQHRRALWTDKRWVVRDKDEVAVTKVTEVADGNEVFIRQRPRHIIRLHYDHRTAREAEYVKPLASQVGCLGVLRGVR
ncbi:hypothetical protein D3C81_1545790 [compost metagenome]